MASYLVTGGAGFIGSHLVEALVSRGDTVRVVDNLVTGHRDNLAHVVGADLTIGNLADSEVVDRVVTGIDYVVHLAAIPSVPRSIADPISSNEANVSATLNLLFAAKRHSVRRVVFASSSSIYGETAALPSREDAPPDPLSPYALQKWMGEQLENDITTAELEAATQQYSDQLSNLVESGKLAEAIAARKEKGASDRKLQEHKKNELRVSTLLTLAKPETMLFVQRYNLLDDLGAALGIDFSVEQIPQPEPMIEPGTYPTTRMLQMATPGERQIMLAETAAWGGAAADSASAQSAMERVRDWTPGSKPLRRAPISQSAR